MTIGSLKYKSYLSLFLSFSLWTSSFWRCCLLIPQIFSGSLEHCENLVFKNLVMVWQCDMMQILLECPVISFKPCDCRTCRYCCWFIQPSAKCIRSIFLNTKYTWYLAGVLAVLPISSSTLPIVLDQTLIPPNVNSCWKCKELLKGLFFCHRESVVLGSSSYVTFSAWIPPERFIISSFLKSINYGKILKKVEFY